MMHWIPNHAFHRCANIWPLKLLAGRIYAGAALFGSLHIIAWNFHFPAPVERLLWRISATSTASAFPGSTYEPDLLQISSCDAQERKASPLLHQIPNRLLSSLLLCAREPLYHG